MDNTLMHSALTAARKHFFNNFAHLAEDERQARWEEYLLNISRSEETSTPCLPNPSDLNCGRNDVEHQSIKSGEAQPAKRRRTVGRSSVRDRDAGPPSKTYPSSPDVASPSQLHGRAMPYDNDVAITEKLPIITGWTSTRSAFQATSRQDPLARAQEIMYLSAATKPVDCDDQAVSEFLESAEPTLYSQIPAGQRLQQQSPITPTFRSQQSSRTSHYSPLSWSSEASHDSNTIATSVGMTRQDSMSNNSFCDGIGMIRLNSAASNHPPPSTDCVTRNAESSTNLPPLSTASIVSQTGGAAEIYDQPLSDVSANYQQGLGYMTRPHINTNARDAISSQSNMKILMPKSSFRMQVTSSAEARTMPTDVEESIDSISRQIDAGPKADPVMIRTHSSDGHEMIRTVSEDGSIKAAIKISKASPPSRLAHERVKCNFPGCQKRPEGYKGEHEMKRHYDRAHKTSHRVYVCAPERDNPAFLAQCKACEGRKKYNADYNAGEHLRRLHFNPKPKVRKGQLRPEEKRGGKGGGDWPEMERLRDFMVTFDVLADGTQLTPARKVNENSRVMLEYVFPDQGVPPDNGSSQQANILTTNATDHNDLPDHTFLALYPSAIATPATHPYINNDLPAFHDQAQPRLPVDAFGIEWPTMGEEHSDALQQATNPTVGPYNDPVLFGDFQADDLDYFS